MNPTSSPASGTVDPKLKAAYDRVMSTPTTGSPPPAAAPDFPPPPATFNTTHAMNTATKPIKVIVTAEETGGLSGKQIAYILLAVLFLAAYTILWMWYFKIITLPF